MNEQVINLGIKFVRGLDPAPPVPGPGTDVTSGLAQTGDFNIALIAGLVLLACALVGFCAYAFIKNKQLVSGAHASNSAFAFLNFSNFSLRAKIISALVAIVAIACIVCGCFSTNAHAADGADSPLVPDKSEITATVAEDGTFTLDTCKLTNEGTEKYTIEKSSVSIAQDVKDIEGLDQTELTINGFGDGKTVFKGKPGNPSEFTPTDLEDLASGASTILTFAIDLPDDVDIETLLDKQVFTISLTPKEVINWIPMQAEIHDGTKIDFYPAFSDVSQITGYRFATYDGSNYQEIQNIASMSDIYSALRKPSTGDPTTTLYYHKTSSATQDLKCYTVKDLNWNYVFGTTIVTGKATAYDRGFSNDYQQDKSGKDNGITTALLDDGFGSGWDVKTSSNTDIPLVNGVNYINEKGSDPSVNGGFYGCYGGWDGGLLSFNSNYPWGCCASDSNFAFYFRVSGGYWGSNSRGSDYGVVLARTFGSSQPTPTEHDITVNCEQEEAVTAGCGAKAEPSKAAKGATVTLTATVGEGYEFEEWETESEIDIAESTSTKTSFTMIDDNVEITAKFKESEPATWIPMQAEIHNETKIDFYPAFNQEDTTVAAYKFAVKNNGVYTEVTPSSGNLTMKDIYNALQPAEGTKTTTLYYQKTDLNAQALSCYTVKDMTWNYVFGNQTTGKAEEYSTDFADNYQRDGKGYVNGITTALLATDGFGSDWNIDILEDHTIPKLANSVPYNNTDTGFYKCYGGYNGGLLSSYSRYPWGCCADDGGSAFFFNVISGGWLDNSRGGVRGVVLARAFN